MNKRVFCLTQLGMQIDHETPLTYQRMGIFTSVFATDRMDKETPRIIYPRRFGVREALVLLITLGKKEKIAKVYIAITRKIKIGVSFAKGSGKNEKVIKINGTTFVKVG